jgi:hypothetical protein
MKSIAAGGLLTLMLFAAAAVCWREARAVRAAADAHRRLVTLRYEHADGMAGVPADSGRLASWLAGLRGDGTSRRAAVSYWLGEYDALAGPAGAGPETRPADLLFVAANAAFRATPASGDPKVRAARLDEVLAAYATVLRADAGNADAAYNYELVARLRDRAGNARRGSKSAGGDAAGESLDSASFDLPPGPTIHGRPGGPPASVPLGEFKATTPMSYDEREQMPQPAAGSRLRRRG